MIAECPKCGERIYVVTQFEQTLVANMHNCKKEESVPFYVHIQPNTTEVRIADDTGVFQVIKVNKERKIESVDVNVTIYFDKDGNQCSGPGEFTYLADTRKSPHVKYPFAAVKIKKNLTKWEGI